MNKQAAEQYDVLIIGAGINGAGVFRDCCEQGLRCLIVDKSDYGSGTSAAPSRLIHGGLKYLETGEFRLVAESTYERNLLLKNAPHYVKPLPTIIPIYSWTKGIGAAIRTFFGSTTAPRSRGAFLIKMGLGFYDFYGARARTMPRHKMMSRKKALKSMPALTPDIVAIGTYYDANITAPERLVWELIGDGLKASPNSKALNWSKLKGAKQGVITINDANGKSHNVEPKIVINAAGPWIDYVNETLGEKTQLIGGTKGSHIVLAHDELLAQLQGRMIYFEGNDGRILLIYPYLGKVLVGSTDIPAKDADHVKCEDDEIDYFMKSLKDLLPNLAFDPSQIVYSYAGIRPLPFSEGIDPGLISRDHSAPILEVKPERPFPIMSLVGGKWTTFRAFSETVTNDILAFLEQARTRSTDDLPIGGGRDFPAPDEVNEWVREVSSKTGLPEMRVKTLLNRYGTIARAISDFEAQNPKMLKDVPDFAEAEIHWLAQNEHVQKLEDVVMRRTQLAITGALSKNGLEEISKTLGAALGWDETRRQTEFEITCEKLTKMQGMNF